MNEIKNKNSTGETDINKDINKIEKSFMAKYTDMFWLFMVGNISGVVIEGIVNYFAHGNWESHVTLLWGPFNLVYGFGAIFIYLASAALKEKSTAVKFFFFAVVCTALEAAVAIFQKRLFNSESWDYSKMPLNFLNSKICLPFTLLWGCIGILFARFVFVPLDRFFDKTVSNGTFAFVSVLLSVFMIINIVFSTAVIYRWGNRALIPEPKNSFESFVDSRYPDDFMQHRFCEWHIYSPEERALLK